MKDTGYAGLFTIEEYLRIEEASPSRHEYVSGVLYAMTAGTKQHSEIIGNIYVAVRPEARRQGCRVFPGDVKVQINADRIYYPDLIVACDPEDSDPLISQSPCLVVEVLHRALNQPIAARRPAPTGRWQVFAHTSSSIKTRFESSTTTVMSRMLGTLNL